MCVARMCVARMCVARFLVHFFSVHDRDVKFFYATLFGVKKKTHTHND